MTFPLFILYHCLHDSEGLSVPIQTTTSPPSVRQTRSKNTLSPTATPNVSQPVDAPKTRSRPVSHQSVVLGDHNRPSSSTVNVAPERSERDETSETRTQPMTTNKKKKRADQVAANHPPSGNVKKARLTRETSSGDKTCLKESSPSSSSSSSHRSRSSYSSSDSSEELEESNTAATREPLRNLQCEVCDRRVSSNSQLLAHMRVHTREKPFTCETCGHRFARKADLKKHILAVHDEVKPFQCRFCQKKFARKTDLSRHQHAHWLQAVQLRPVPEEVC